MNKDFSRIITLLRKEKGLSQKQAATDLNISQALLSHYEKGIRECGLDFVIKLSNYYNVSCDYLLGLTPNKDGTKLTIEDIPDPTILKDNVFTGSVLPTLNKKLLFNSINIIFDLLQKINNKHLIESISAYIMISVYNAFRFIYSANPKNPQGLFSIESVKYKSLTNASLCLLESDINDTINNSNKNKDVKVNDVRKIVLSPSKLTVDYSLYASSLYNLIQSTENSIKSKIK